MLGVDCTHDKYDNNIIKFAEDTTVIGLISDSDEKTDRSKVKAWALCCHDNKLSFNGIKTNHNWLWEDQRELYSYFNRLSVKTVGSFRLVDTHITDTLTWSFTTTAEAILPEAPQEGTDVPSRVWEDCKNFERTVKTYHNSGTFTTFAAKGKLITSLRTPATLLMDRSLSFHLLYWPLRNCNALSSIATFS